MWGHSGVIVIAGSCRFIIIYYRMALCQQWLLFQMVRLVDTNDSVS